MLSRWASRKLDEDNLQENPHQNHHKKNENRKSSRASGTRSSGSREKLKERPKSFDESILGTRESSEKCVRSKSCAVSISRRSVLPGPGTGNEVTGKRAYPLPKPTCSSGPSLNFHRNEVVFGSETLWLSGASSPGSPTSLNDDGGLDAVLGDFGSFRAVEETNNSSSSTTSCSGTKSFNIHAASPRSPFQWESGFCSSSPESQGIRCHPCHPLPRPPDSPIKSPNNLQSKWLKGKLLGNGTFGHIYAGFNSENGQMCAIKEVRLVSNDEQSNECLKQLNQEIALLSELSHPNIVEYYGSNLRGEKLSVYLEYVSGGSIHKLLSEYGPFSEHVIRNYTKQILSGLVYLHGRNTVHRDIKGANILVGPNGEIKLADFGMAKHITSFSSMLSFKGSPYWMAPEVIMNNGGYSLAVDIWSLGCTILEMATSKPPWSDYEGIAAIFKIANSKGCPEIPNRLSEDAQGFVRLCLQRDPSARPTAAQLLHHPFIQNQSTKRS